MTGVTAVAERMVASFIVGELWVDGSFLTQKMDPDDADVILHCGGGLFNEAYPEQIDALQWIIANRKLDLLCDTYPLFRYEENHPLRVLYDFDRALYMAKFGFKDGGDEG